MIRLEPMDQARFLPYVERLTENYAAEHVRNGRWTPEEGPTEARKEIAKLLPAGVATPGHFIYSLRSEPGGEEVGILWLAFDARGAFIYDIEVHEQFRRRGYAREAMIRAEEVARAHKARRLSLHVFGQNAPARQLYTELGYRETNVVMTKELGD